MIFSLAIALSDIYFKMGNYLSILGITHLTEIALYLVRSTILTTSIERASYDNSITVYWKSLLFVSAGGGGKTKL